MGNELKKIRGQIRQVVQELLPEVMTSEIINKAMSELSEKLNRIEQKQKDLQSYLLRNEIAKVKAKAVVNKAGS